MMHGREESDSAIVAAKPTNAVEPSAAEPAEPRAGTEGNAGQRSTGRMQSRETVSQGLERIRQAARQRKLHPWPSVRFAVRHPRWEPYALIGHVRFCAGGAQQ